MRSADGLGSADGGRSPIAPGQVLVAPGPGGAIAGPGLVTYYSDTSRYLPAGTYTVAWNVVNAHTDISIAGVQVSIAGTPIPTSTVNSAESTNAPPNSRLEITGSGRIVHAGGTLTVLVQVRRTTGAGNVIPQSATIEIRKVF